MSENMTQTQDSGMGQKKVLSLDVIDHVLFQDQKHQKSITKM